MIIKNYIYKLIIISFLSLAYSIDVGDIIITEYFCRSNEEIPDYIEIYNTSSNEIILSNIEVQFGDTEPWELPYYTLESNDYVLLISAEGLFRDIDGNVYLPEDDPRRNPDNEMYDDGYEIAPILPNSILIGDDDGVLPAAADPDDDDGNDPVCSPCKKKLFPAASSP